MKNCTNRLWALLFIGCFASFSLLAQSNNVTIVKSITDDEKNTTTEEVTVELENLTAVLENLETHLEGLEGKEVELTVDFENQEGAVEQEEEVFYFRAAGSSQSDDQVKSLKIFSVPIKTNILTSTVSWEKRPKKCS